MAVSMPTWLPTRKVLTGGIVSIATWGICTLARRYGGLDLPADSVGAVVSTAGTLAAYFVPPAERDLLGKVDTVVRAEAAGDPQHDALVAALIGATKGEVVLPAGTRLPVALTLPAAANAAAATLPSLEELAEAVSNRVLAKTSPVAATPAVQVALNPAVFAAPA